MGDIFGAGKERIELGRRPETCFLKTCLLLALAGIFFALLLCHACHGRELKFPLANDICPTSSFGSWRSGHFHAGVDFSTGGVTGVPVLAVDTCYVWRVRIWHGGYGKALYAQLPDEKIAVYGHLSRLIPAIEETVEAEQDLVGRYDIELYFDPQAFTFLPGDTIGFSGETGWGPPHLHFELRSGRDDHSNINPVPDYLDLRESLPPEIKRIQVMPIGPGSLVDGSDAPLTLKRTEVGDTLNINGEFGIAASAIDNVQCGRTITPTVYEAWIDGAPVCTWDMDTFPFAKRHFVDAFYETRHGSRFVRLFDRYDLNLEGLSYSGKPLGSRIGEGVHEMVIKVADAWGNSDSLSVPFVYGRVPEFETLHVAEGSSGLKVEVVSNPPGCAAGIRYRHGTDDWYEVEVSTNDDGHTGFFEEAGAPLEVWCRITSGLGMSRECVVSTGVRGGREPVFAIGSVVHEDYLEIYAVGDPPSSLPVAHIQEGDSLETKVLQPVDIPFEGRFVTWYVPKGFDDLIRVTVACRFGSDLLERTQEVRIEWLEAASRVWLKGDMFDVALHVPVTYNKRSLVALGSRDRPAESYSGFETTAGRVDFALGDIFFDDRLEVVIVPRDTVLTDKHGVFADNGEWPVFLGRFGPDRTCAVRRHRLDPLIVLEDQEPPKISSIGGLRRRPRDGKATFSARISDEGSGVAAGTIRGFVDDTIAIVGFDPDTGTVSGRSTKPLRYGQHRIRLEAEDRLGNGASVERTVDLAR